MRYFLAFGLALFLVSDAGFGGVGVWTTNGPANTQFGTELVGDPQVPGTLYAGTDFGIAKSTDGGLTWSTPSDTAGQTIALAAWGGTVYRSTGGCTVGLPATCSFTVSKSVDGGEHWADLLTSSTGSNYARYGITIAPSSPSTLYRVTSLSSYPPTHSSTFSGAFHRSTDGGQSWAEIDQSFGGAQISAVAVDPKTSSTLYVALWPAGTGQLQSLQRIYRSTDSGSTWTLLSPTVAYVGALAVDPVTPTTLYAATYSGLFKSIDGGDTFALINSMLGSAANVSAMVIDPTRPNRVYAGTINGQGVFASSDAGQTWVSISNGLSGASLYVAGGMAIDPTGNYLHIGTEASPGVYDYEVTSSACTTDSHTLCLNNGRFAVTAEFQSTPGGPFTPATAVLLTSETGYFWFFDPSNIELVTKVLNGCGTSGHYWFFAGGLTNVGVQITVTDTLDGTQKPYSNPIGTPFAPIQDTSAFATCP